MNYFEFEKKYQNWIESHRVKYLFILSFVGSLLGIGAGILLCGSFKMGLMFGMIYSTIFIIVDLTREDDKKW